MGADRKIVRVVKRRPLNEGAGTDVAFWRSQAPEARIAALEEIRRDYIQWRYGAQQGLQRVYRVVKRA